MRLLDLFSGIGGFALATQKTFKEDLEIVGFCEIEDYARRVLSKNFPGVPIHEDICKMDGNNFKDIDLITGGFPCQDISISGEGKGIKNGTRSGLWFELHRIISEVRPKFALIENVPMLTRRGGTRVISDLTNIGYDCEWQVISATEIGARHLRKRIWIVAYPKNHIRRECSMELLNYVAENNMIRPSGTRHQLDLKDQVRHPKLFPTPTANEDAAGTPKGKMQRMLGNCKEVRSTGRGTLSSDWVEGLMGISSWMDGSWEEGIPRVKEKQENKTKRLTGLGNAIVPTNAQIIMEFIKPHITQQEK